MRTKIPVSNRGAYLGKLRLLPVVVLGESQPATRKVNRAAAALLRLLARSPRRRYFAVCTDLTPFPGLPSYRRCLVAFDRPQLASYTHSDLAVHLLDAILARPDLARLLS